MKKPTEVLFRLHSIRTPDALGVEVTTRDDEALKQRHSQLGILPGQKVFETVTSRDKPWRLDQVSNDLKEGGYTLLRMNIELRPGSEPGSIKPVLSLFFGENEETTCTAEQVKWVQAFLKRTVYKLAQAYCNPRQDGSSQVAIDCAVSTPRVPGLKHLPVRRLIGLSPKKPTTTASSFASNSAGTDAVAAGQ